MDRLSSSALGQLSFFFLFIGPIMHLNIILPSYNGSRKQLIVCNKFVIKVVMTSIRGSGARTLPKYSIRICEMNCFRKSSILKIIYRIIIIRIIEM